MFYKNSGRFLIDDDRVDFIGEQGLNGFETFVVAFNLSVFDIRGVNIAGGAQLHADFLAS